MSSESISQKSSSDIEFKTASQAYSDLHGKLEVFGCELFSQQDFSSMSLKEKEDKSLAIIDCVIQKLKSAMEETFDIKLPDLDVKDYQDKESLKKSIKDLKEKYNDTDNQSEKIKLLTLLPDHWSYTKACKEFGCSRYKFQEARKLKGEKGILGVRPRKNFHFVSDEIKDNIVKFYRDQNNSRICPGAKEYLSVVDSEGKREQLQKQMLLFDLKDLYDEWKKTNSHLEKMPGFSTFAKLRPKECVLVGAPGTHTVCICPVHQNIKMKIKSICQSFTYRQFLARTVCSFVESKQCMLNECTECRGKNGLLELIELSS